METIEVHSKDFLIRWVEVTEASWLTWSLLPNKRSINFGVFSHSDVQSRGHNFAEAAGGLSERLEASGFKSLSNGGLVRIESKELTEGNAKVETHSLVAFVFDNTFSRNNSKHVQFSFNVERIAPARRPSGGENASSQQARPVEGYSAAAAAAASAALYPRSPEASPADNSANIAFPSVPVESPAGTAPGASRKMSISHRKSHEHLSRSKSFRRGTLPTTNGTAHEEEPLPARKIQSRNTFNSISSGSDSGAMKSLDGRYVTGFLQKKRRKNFQGFARRYFSLDKQTGLLNYYLNNRSSSLRGVMPIKIAQLKADSSSLQWTLNSGMERWTLKANDVKTFNSWCSELKEVRSASMQDESELESEDDGLMRSSASGVAGSFATNSSLAATNSESSLASLPKPELVGAELPAVDKLRSLILALPDSEIRRDLKSAYLGITKEVSEVVDPQKKKGFFKSTDGKTRPSAKSRLSQATIIPLMRRRKRHSETGGLARQFKSRNFLGMVGAGCIVGLVYGLTFTLFFVGALVGATAGGYVQFRGPAATHALKEESSDERFKDPRMLSGSDDDDELEDFSDASDEEDRGSVASVSYVPQNLTVSETSSMKTAIQQHDGEEQQPGTEDAQQNHATDAPVAPDEPVGATTSVPTAETSLYPLPHAPVRRRTNVPGPAHAPPSILAILRKASDPANMTAPITINEPLSGVQVPAEMYENADLLDAASKAPPKSHQRVLLVALFAVSRFSVNRLKERTQRKPFTPLLGETYELVREDLQLRFVAEKVMHKPEVIATQAESPLWTVYFTSRPHSKMWAKSVQLTDAGHISITFPDGESVSFIYPEMFIRNIYGSERYIEPSGTATVESSSGIHAKIEFKAGGMFSGRSEDVKITCGNTTYEGKWTEALYEGTKKVWSAKPLVDNAAKHYGWPLFTAQINEVTPIEKGALPPNDSRLRPDLREYEGQSNIDESEQIKLELEQHQRERRKDMEVAGKQHEPFFFVKSKDSKGHYVLRHGEKNYWVLRQKQQWDSIPRYFH